MFHVNHSTSILSSSSLLSYNTEAGKIKTEHFKPIWISVSRYDLDLANHMCSKILEDANEMEAIWKLLLLFTWQMWALRHLIVYAATSAVVP